MLFTKVFSVLAGAVTLVQGQYNTGNSVRPNPSNGHWVDAWASMPQLTEPANLPPAPFVRRQSLLMLSLLIKIAEPKWCSLRQLHHPTNPVHDDRGFTDSDQNLKRLRWLELAHYSSHSCFAHQPDSRHPRDPG